MAETYSAGIVTAYGAAVRGGYTKTYEQWCQDMANLGANVAEVRTKAAQAAQSAGNAAGSATAAETAQGKAEDAQEAAEQAQSDAEAAATNAASSATAASAAATAAGNAQTAAETAQGKAEDAQEAAEQAQSDAEAAAQSVSQSAAQISQNTSDISDLKSAASKIVPIELFKGNNLINKTVLFNVGDLFGADQFYYNFDVVTGKASYLELMDSSDQRISIIGKTSSSSGDLHYEGFATVPSNLAYVRWNTNANGGNTINLLAVYPSKEFLTESAETIEKGRLIQQTKNFYVVQEIIYTASTDLSVSYAFSLRNIYLPKGKSIYISVPNYALTLFLYDEYGNFIGKKKQAFDGKLAYTATNTCFVGINVVAIDTTVTFNNDYIGKSGAKIYCDYEKKAKVNSAQIVSRINIPASQHENKKLRIPSIKILPNRNKIAAYEVRDAIQDGSPSYLGYSVIYNNEIIAHGGIAEKEEGEIRQFNPQIYTLSNGNILILWASNDEEDVCAIHYATSSDNGLTWSEPGTIADTVISGENIILAPANGVWVSDKILIPAYLTPGTYDENNCRSGLMLLDPSDMTHTEKFVSDKIKLNECNVFLNGDTAILTARRENSSPSRKVYTIDTALSGSFTAQTYFYYISQNVPNRVICQESYFKTDYLLYFTKAEINRSGISMFASDDLSRGWTKIVQLVNQNCNGYSCIDIVDNSIVTITEGDASGLYLCVDTVIIGATV